MGKTHGQNLFALWQGKHPHGRGEDQLSSSGSTPTTETPPRAWGRHAAKRALPSLLRNTPTGVGKTPSQLRRQRGSQKHPHGRGEDRLVMSPFGGQMETPPRAWGRQAQVNQAAGLDGNTPTGVGKTVSTDTYILDAWKHPHGRGEDRLAHSLCRVYGETPPRAWGRLFAGSCNTESLRNTPTGVGKTEPLEKSVSVMQKHPHGRGEDTAGQHRARTCQETPPRAWGRPDNMPIADRRGGNTPTGVGKTHLRNRRRTHQKKHPHGRGEDRFVLSLQRGDQETPPRAWGRRSARAFSA